MVPQVLGKFFCAVVKFINVNIIPILRLNPFSETELVPLFLVQEIILKRDSLYISCSAHVRFRIIHTFTSHLTNKFATKVPVRVVNSTRTI